MTAFEQILDDAEVGLFAIDLRGTLIGTPRVTHLLPELDSCGVPRPLALSAQERFDEQLRGPLQQRGDILDWTRCAAESMASMVGAAGHPFDVDFVVAAFQERYLREAQRLIEPWSLRQAGRTLGSRCAIVADGPLQRETAVLAACFEGDWVPPLVSSECLGVNKLSADFFVRLSRRWGVAPTATVVVGDRWDKDVLIPRRAGCRGLLVGSASPDGASVESLRRLFDSLAGRLRPCPA